MFYILEDNACNLGQSHLELLENLRISIMHLFLCQLIFKWIEDLNKLDLALHVGILKRQSMLYQKYIHLSNNYYKNI